MEFSKFKGNLTQRFSEIRRDRPFGISEQSARHPSPDSQLLNLTSGS